MKELLEDIELTKQIIQYTTLLSNNSSNDFDLDAKRIIDFISDSYNDKNKEAYYDLILYQISNLSLNNEMDLLFNSRKYNDNFSELEIFYSIKGKCMLTINQISEMIKEYGSGLFSEFDYRRIIPYNAKERAESIFEASKYGAVELSVMSGILYATGIGTKRNLKMARLRFLQAAYWGYFPAFKYAAYVSGELGEKNKNKLYSELYDACNKFLSEGITIIPSDYALDYEEQTHKEFFLISSFYFDVIILYKVNNINFSFIEVILLDDIKYLDKMEYINKYIDNNWKEVTNGSKSFKPKGKFGFDV